VEATKLLKDNGFKIGYHMMLGLPLSNPKKDFEMYKILFKNENFKPDQLKIYPCQVLCGAELVKLYKTGEYKPYSKEQIQDLIVKIMKIIPNYCRVMRVMREIPPEYLVAGTTRIDLRKDIEDKLRAGKNKIQEIRFREIGFAVRDLEKGRKINNKLNLKITKYKASNGTEYFLEFVNQKNILFGLCRLRVGVKCKEPFALIRELHVYGQALGVGEQAKELGQHRGLGKELMKKAEEIARPLFSKKDGNKKFRVLKVISGVGVREYYKKLGYRLDKEKIYMEKEL
ncbi:MAG: tRNA uridine(34) 5-carboxymethylaminomethyl modification radical SAM/GNAT enzyme Elp3, partial [Candidatus Pacearchaeota archaeon]